MNIKGQALPTAWRPSHEQVAYGLDLGLTERQVLDCAADMKLWAEANSNRPVARKARWGAAFKGWMRRAAARNKPRYENLSYMDIANGLRESNDVNRDSERTEAADLFSASARPRNPQHD
jgi:hypothetical protein